MIEENIISIQNSSSANTGAVALVVLIRENQIYTVNLGDCRAILVDDSTNYKILNH
jgi:serine/threonine protein phosphatase PrpC